MGCEMLRHDSYERQRAQECKDDRWSTKASIRACSAGLVQWIDRNVKGQKPLISWSPCETDVVFKED